MLNIQKKFNETYNRLSSFDNRFSRLKSPKTSTSSSSAITQAGLSKNDKKFTKPCFILCHSYNEYVAKNKHTSQDQSMTDLEHRKQTHAPYLTARNTTIPTKNYYSKQYKSATCDRENHGLSL